MSRAPPTTIVADRTALPVFEQIRPAQIMLRGSSQPLNVQTATANFMAKIILKPTKKGKKKDEKSICESWRKCWKCSAEFHFDPTKPHECYHVTCTNCGEFKHVNHRCFIQPVQPKEDTAQEDAFEDPMAFQNEDDD